MTKTNVPYIYLMGKLPVKCLLTRKALRTASSQYSPHWYSNLGKSSLFHHNYTAHSYSAPKDTSPRPSPSQKIKNHFCLWGWGVNTGLLDGRLSFYCKTTPQFLNHFFTENGIRLGSPEPPQIVIAALS